MLYVGNFSYNDDNDPTDNYCLMPCLVSAEDADDALDKFADLLWRLHRTSDLLDGAREVYRDSLVELEGAPSDAVLCQWQKIVPAAAGLCSITSALPEPDLPHARADACAEEDDGVDVDLDDADLDFDELEETDESPFLSFEDQ